MSETCIIGVDLGGTNIRACAYSENGSPIGEKFSFPSNAQSGTAAIYDAIVLTIESASKSAAKRIDGIGMAIPGIIDDINGVVRWAPNFGETIDGVFHYWKNIPIREGISSRLPASLTMGNDANLAALGEYQFGSGKNSASCLVMLTVGTGIGGGVVLGQNSVQGRAQGPLLLVGGNQGGVELGHTVLQANGLDCPAGTYGALEAYCQRDSIIGRAQYRLQRGRKSILNDLIKGDYGKLSPAHLTEAADLHDELAIQVWQEVGAMLGIGIGNMINIFAPEIVAIGGQISKAGKWLIEPAIEAARDVAIPSLFEYAKINQAEQIDDAGILGGAALALQMVNQRQLV